MILQGHIQNGVVVFDIPVSLPEGTAVRVEPLAPTVVDFWHGPSLEELTAQQGVKVATSFEELVGGWPEDEVNDGFEYAVVQWRRRELDP